MTGQKVCHNMSCLEVASLPQAPQHSSIRLQNLVFSLIPLYPTSHQSMLIFPSKIAFLLLPGSTL